MHRLFVAIEIPEDIREGLERLCEGLAGANWNAPENMHLTLRFIGEVDGCTMEEVAAVLSRVNAAAFTLQLDGLGHFESRRRPRVLWAGLAPSQPLAALQRQIEAAVLRAGLERERRKYKPHVTLARMREVSPEQLSHYLATHSLLASEPFAADGFTLFSSLLGHDGAFYRREAVYPFDWRDQRPERHQSSPAT